jgi:nitrogen fixation protein FixH
MLKYLLTAGNADSSSFPIKRPGKKRPRELTGRMVLVCFLAFFGVVFGVNGVMVHEALSTFSGVETESSYQAGQMFEHDVAMAKAQDEQHWQIDAKVTHAADGNAHLDVLTRMDATATFERPTDRRLDRRVAVSESAPGHFSGSAAISPGQWDLIIELSRQGNRLFRSKNRVVIR